MFRYWISQMTFQEILDEDDTKEDFQDSTKFLNYL